MAVSTQKPNVFHVRVPISKTPTPRVVPVFGPNFRGGVDVVNVQGAMIGEPALGAFPAKARDEFKFPFPVARVLVNAVAVFVPVVLLTAWRTKTCFRRLVAALALAGVRPPVPDVASLTAELTCAIAQTIRVHRFGLVTVLANDLNGRGSHVSKYTTPNNHKYFDIACERIENAQRQARLFA